jgi:hypothetical protein
VIWICHPHHLIGDLVGLAFEGIARLVDRELALQAATRTAALQEGAGPRNIRRTGLGAVVPRRRPARWRESAADAGKG